MKRSALSCITVIVFCVTAFGQTQPRKFYEYEIVESTRPGVEVYAAPSINDYGDVAFAARLTPGGGTVFLNVMGQANVDLLPNSPSTHFVGGRVQINNSRQIIHQTFISGTKPAQTFIRRINGGVGDYTIVAYANGAGSFNDFDQLYGSAIGLNNEGEPVYTGVVNNTGTNLITGLGPISRF